MASRWVTRAAIVAEVGTQQAIVRVLNACRAALTQCFPNEPSTEVVDVILDATDKALQSYLAGKGTLGGGSTNSSSPPG